MTTSTSTMTTSKSTTPQAPDLATVKRRQQVTWASGDFSVVAARIALISELLADSADIRAGSRVLDVATGSGNAAIAAGRSGASVLGVDYVPALLEYARLRAADEGLDVEFAEGDAENLPVPDQSFDTVLSVVGTMFAPDHARTAGELVRVCRRGGTIALASWTPDGFIGHMFRTISTYVPPPAGLASPLLWGTEAHLGELFGGTTTGMRCVQRICTLRHRSPEDFVSFFRRWYGPTLKAFEALDEAGQQALADDLTALARRGDRHQDGGPVAIPAVYMETIMRRR
jgi:SAM-dependent methyltransferase